MSTKGIIFRNDIAIKSSIQINYLQYLLLAYVLLMYSYNLLLACITPKQTTRNRSRTTHVSMEQHMTSFSKPQLRLTTIIAGLLLTMIPLLTGCGGGGETGSDPSVTVTPGNGGGGSAAPVGATASLAWSPVPDTSIIAYFVYYGRVSPGTPGNCSYESSVQVTSPSATVTNLDSNTLYYFTVSAYNGLESACSSEVSTVTPPPSV